MGDEQCTSPEDARWVAVSADSPLLHEDDVEVSTVSVIDGTALIGGRRRLEATAQLNAYVAHRRNGQWTDAIPPVPGTRVDHIVAWNGGYVVAASLIEALGGVSVARWDGAAWHSMDEEFWYEVEALHAHRGVLYASGVRGTVHDVGGRDIARWTGSGWESIRPPADGLLPDGRLGDIYLVGAEEGGVFLAANRGDSLGRPRATLFRWDVAEETWSALQAPPTSDQDALKMGVIQNGRAFVLGDGPGAYPDRGTKEISGAETIEVWDLSSGSWVESRNLPAVLSNETDDVTLVTALAADDRGTVYIAGNFDGTIIEMGAGEVRHQEARPLGCGVEWKGSVRAMAVHQDTLFVVGNFDRAGDKSAPGVAAWVIE